MSEPTLDEIAASVERLTDDSARLLQQQLMERLDPYRAGGGSPGGMVAGATPLNVARLISAGLVTADAIAAGAITADKLSVGLVGSRNLLVNGGFRDGLTGWTFVQNGDTSAFTILWQTDADWTLRDGDIDGWNGTGAPYGSSVSVMSTATTTKEPFLSQAYIPVTAGQVYSLSALVGNHRCASIRASIWWYDAANTFISAVASTYYAGAKNGGPWYDGWERLRIEGETAPATATNASVVLVATTPYTSGSDCYMFVDQVWFGAGAYAREFDPQEASRFHNSTGEVVIDSSGVTITNGALTVTNPGSTVIIDGTSNMFKIVASGTGTHTQAANTAGDVKILALAVAGSGLPDVTSPAYLCYITEGLTPTTNNDRHLTELKISRPLYGAGSSGGVANGLFDAITWRAGCLSSAAAAGGELRLWLGITNRDGVSRSALARYHILKEAAV